MYCILMTSCDDDPLPPPPMTTTTTKKTIVYSIFVLATIVQYSSYNTTGQFIFLYEILSVLFLLLTRSHTLTHALTYSLTCSHEHVILLRACQPKSSLSILCYPLHPLPYTLHNVVPRVTECANIS
jgi:hypothetical protein